MLILHVGLFLAIMRQRTISVILLYLFMKNIQFHYLYRDGANYKNLNSVVSDNNLNPDNIGLSELEALIRTKLVDGEWFYAIIFGDYQICILEHG